MCPGYGLRVQQQATLYNHNNVNLMIYIKYMYMDIMRKETDDLSNK